MNPLLKNFFNFEKPKTPNLNQISTENLLKLLETPKGKRNYSELLEISNLISVLLPLQKSRNEYRILAVFKISKTPMK